MRQSLGIKEVLGCPEPDNFVRKHWKMIQVCGVYCWSSTLKNLKNLKNKLKTKCSKCLKFICRQYQAEVQFVCADCKKGNISSTFHTYVTFISIKILHLLAKMQLFPYFIVYVFHRFFEKSQRNNQMFEDFGFVFHKV